jgi:hypothetical protein
MGSYTVAVVLQLRCNTQITHITQNNTPHSNKTQHTNNKGHTTHNEEIQIQLQLQLEHIFFIFWEH